MSFAWHINKRSKLCSVLQGARTATIVSEEQEIKVQLHRAGAAVIMALEFTPNAKINLGSSKLAAHMTVGCFKNLVSTAHHKQYLTHPHKLGHNMTGKSQQVLGVQANQGTLLTHFNCFMEDIFIDTNGSLGE